ncbi:unnamed protein product [Gemmataceae bacterium]|nr:unnamed protein product [Gemmataceae bacterium]VTT99071.1 unnamed protein product [Gemmataceae bacterium]
MTAVAEPDLAATLAAVEGSVKKREAELSKAYAELISKTARGQTVPPDVVASKLSECGKDFTTFRSDVERAIARRAARAEAEQLAARQRVVAEIEQRAAAVQATFDAEVKAAQQKFAEASGKLQAENAAAKNAVRNSENAINALQNTASGAANARLAAAHEAMRQTGKRWTAATEAQKGADRYAAQWVNARESKHPNEARAANAQPDHDPLAELRAEVARAQAEVAAAEAALLTEE